MATVGELGEREVLRRVLRRLGPSRAVVGPGDDAAVLAVPDGRVVVTVDTLIEGPDFRLAWTSGADLGWKAAAVNLADVAAMGARPTVLFVALAMPPTTDIEFVESFAGGLRAACDALAPGCTVEGGDLAASPVVTVAVTALGVLHSRPTVLRSGARAGDVLAVAGELGDAAEGLRILRKRFTDAAGEPVPVDLDVLGDDDRRAVVAQLRPSPPIALGPQAAGGGATAMMDVSDGLVLDATRLAEASRVTIDIDRSTLGPHPRRVLDAGESHALLATFPAALALPPGFRRIGRVVVRRGAPVLVDGRAPRGRAGWDPYTDS